MEVPLIVKKRKNKVILGRLFAKVMIVTIAFSITRCDEKKDIENALKGSWSIDTLYYGSLDIKMCYSSNILRFNNDGNMILPHGETCDGYKSIFPEGRFELDYRKDKALLIKIKTGSMVFNGSHKLMFIDDKENKLLKMHVFSDSLFIVARKGLFGYDNNKSLIQKLVRLSN